MYGGSADSRSATIFQRAALLIRTNRDIPRFRPGSLQRIGSARARPRSPKLNDASQQDCDPHRTYRAQRYSLRESSQSVGTLSTGFWYV
ncbi:hypothetical protein F4680DRAFT_20257 [Xylaria scruposa]|nr:hypothetical protein F4680DRAFT_20257 [Xylaria scruposa]